MIALVTPIKDEKNNLSKLISSIETQTVVIDTWIIVENDSIDGTKEELQRIKNIKNVNNLIIKYITFEDKSYKLGLKYSKVVNKGFKVLKELEDFRIFKFIGILDADSFPVPNYYENLIKFMSSDNQIGLSSGVLLLDDGSRGFSNKNHVRGSGRLWKMECFIEAGYEIGMSADSNSRIKAELRGWKVKVCDDAIFYSREANSRYDLTYGGRSAYYNGFTLFYVLTKSMFYAFINWKAGLSYLKGYLISKTTNQPKNSDVEIINYNRDALFKKLKKLKYDL